MDEARIDKRIIKTKALIRTAYLNSLEELGFRKTTVSEICNRAYISRKAFYSHYETIDALFVEVMDECFEHQNNRLSVTVHKLQEAYYYTEPEIYRACLCEKWLETVQAVKKHSDVLRIFFNLDEPYVNEYIRKRCIDTDLPISPSDSVPVRMAREMIGEEKYIMVKFAVMEDTTAEEISRFMARTVDTYAHFLYTNSDTFRRAYGLEKSKNFEDSGG
ncbi:MAG: TetR/AcrR family transcriptional regulator [Candidatus Scatomorpha sp.]